MTPLSVADLAAAVGGRLEATDGRALVTDVVIDSRNAHGSSLFVALAGEHTDGHDHAATAGAAAVLANRPVGVPAVVVDDVLVALGRLARQQLAAASTTVVGVTGSSGKTTTKDVLGQVLARLGPTVAAAGSYNNEIGLPLTVLRADAGTRYLVLEYGARGPGHIRALTRNAPPDVAVVLNVGSAHLGEFGSRAAIARAKAELVESAPLAVLNADDQLVRRMRPDALTFGVAADAAVRGVDVRTDEHARASFDLLNDGARAHVSLRLVGVHQVSNALAAAAVALSQSMSVEATAAALSVAEPSSGRRMQVVDRPDGVTVVNDAYNANPESVRAALEALALLGERQRRRTWAVLGAMLELGERTTAEHQEVGRLAVRLGTDHVVVVGDPTGPVGALHAAAIESAGASTVHAAPDVPAVLTLLRAELRPGDVVLVKASRGAALDHVADALLATEVAA